MPTRFVDGEGVWGSRKLKQVTPDFFQPFYAGMIPLAMANGTFECDAATVQYRVCGFRQAHLSEEFIAMMLDEFERVKLLFRWKVGTKEWGYWVGIEKPGRLPADSQKYKYAKGEPLPDAELQAWLQEEVPPYQVDPEAINKLVTELLKPTVDLLGTSRVALDISVRIAGKHCIGKVRVGKVGSADAPAGTEQIVQETGSAVPTSPPYLLSSQEPDEQAPVTQEIVPVPSTANPGPVAVPAKVKAPAAGYAPVYRTVRAAVSTAATARAIAPTSEPWNALNFAFERRDDWEGLTSKELQRVVLYHMKVDKKQYWASRVESLEDLSRCLPTMTSQTPKDFRLSGEVTLVIGRTADTACALCEGQGFTVGRNEAYVGIDFPQANWCPCAKEDTRPWLNWKPTRHDE